MNHKMQIFFKKKNINYKAKIIIIKQARLSLPIHENGFELR